MKGWEKDCYLLKLLIFKIKYVAFQKFEFCQIIMGLY